MENKNTKVPFYKKKGVMIPLMAVLVLGLATAMVVPYLSNMQTASVQVSSPFTLSPASITLNSSDAYNLQTVDSTLKNNANTNISALDVITISSNTGSVDGSEFAVLEIGSNDTSSSECSAENGVFNATDGYCYWNALPSSADAKYFAGVVGSNYVVEFGGNKASPSTIPANALIHGRMLVQFNVNAQPGEYTFSSQMMMPNQAPI